MITVRFNNEFGRNIATVSFNGVSLATLPEAICAHSSAATAHRVEISINRPCSRGTSPAYLMYVQRHLTGKGLYLSRISVSSVKGEGRGRGDFWSAFVRQPLGQ